jgi:hypothetical protein
MRWQWPSGFAIVQFPNAPLAVALLASIAGDLTQGAGNHLALAVFYPALSLWAYGEARHGDNWFRRSLGVGVAIYIIISLIGRLSV